MEWKDIASSIGNVATDAAPGLAALLAVTGVGAPVGAAVAAIGALGRAFGLGSNPKPEDLQKAIQADPEALIKLRVAEMDFTLKMREQDLEELKAQLLDVQSARAKEVSVVQSTGRRDVNLYLLAYLYILGFFGSTGVMIWAVCTDHFPQDIPQAAVFLLGNLFGALTAGSGAVVQYFFGSSKGSTEKSDAMSAALIQSQKDRAVTEKRTEDASAMRDAKTK